MWHSEFPSSRESDDNSHVEGEAVRRRRLARALAATPWMTPALRWVLIVRCKGGGHGKGCDGSESMNGNVWNVGGLMSRETPAEPPAFRSSFIYLQILLFISFDLSGRSRRTRRVDDGGEAFFFFFPVALGLRRFSMRTSNNYKSHYEIVLFRNRQVTFNLNWYFLIISIWKKNSHISMSYLKKKKKSSPWNQEESQ